VKAWRRSARESPPAAGTDCGDQPSELALQLVGGTDVVLTWNWPFGASSLIIEEENLANPGVWVLVDGGVTAADEIKSWTSSFNPGDTIDARIRRVGSDESCSVVSNPLELE
jgi:hypothetical protein